MTGEHVAGPALLEAVREDPDLAPEEKETTLRLGKRDDLAAVYTAEAGLARRLLAHPHVRVEGVTVADGAARRDVAPEETQRGRIVGVRARVPVGVVSVRSSPRATSQHAEIVSDRVFNHVEVSP
jgi:hypothetical protein